MDHPICHRVGLADTGAIVNHLLARPSSTLAVVAPHSTHELWRNRDNVWCRKCGVAAQWSLDAATPAAVRRECRGSSADRWIPPGSRAAVQPTRIEIDDGVLALDFLASKAARPMGDLHKHADDNLSQLGSTTLRGLEHPLTDSEDPFGHLAMDMSEDPDTGVRSGGQGFADVQRIASTKLPVAPSCSIMTDGTRHACTG